MPPRGKITRDSIAEAAFRIARARGAEYVNARSVAEELHCSTQPVLYHFATVEEVRQAAYHRADRFHSVYLMTIPEDAAEPMLEIGLNYIRFAIEDPHLFRFLFQSGFAVERSLPEMVDSDELKPVLGFMGEAMGLGPEQTREVFLTLALLVHGYASLIASGGLVYDEKAVAAHLERACRGAALAMEEETK